MLSLVHHMRIMRNQPDFSYINDGLTNCTQVSSEHEEFVQVEKSV